MMAHTKKNKGAYRKMLTMLASTNDSANEENVDHCEHFFNTTRRTHQATHTLRGKLKDLKEKIIVSYSNYVCLAFHTDIQIQFTGYFITYDVVD